MLEACGVGGITCDRHVYVLKAHNCNTLGNVVRTVNSYGRTLAVAVGGFFNNLNLACKVVHFGLNIGEAVYAGNNECRVLAQAVEYDLEGSLSDLVCGLSNTDCALCRGKGFVSGKESEALGAFS